MQLIRSVLNKIYHYFNAIFYGLIALLFSMCNASELDFDGIETPPYTPTLVAPIGTTTYTILSLIDKLDDPNIEITEDNARLISISYRDTTSFNDYLSIISLEDVTNDGIIDPALTPSLGPSPQKDTIDIDDINLTFEYTSPNNEELDSVKYTAGTITIDIQNGFDSDVDYQLRLSDIISIDTEDLLILSGKLPAGGSHSDTKQLANYKTIISKDVSGNNIFNGIFSGEVLVETGDFINGTEQITYTLTITGAEFSEIYGWFGDKPIDIENQTLEIDFFEGISENGLVFNNPQLNFYINNGFGVPMGLNFGDVSASNVDGTLVNLSGAITTTPQFVRAPSTSQVGTIATSVIRINESNSNLRDLFAISPNVFNLNLTAESNYTNDNDAGDADRNFVTTDSEVEVVTEVNLPLNVQLTDVTRDFPTGIEGFDFEEADTIKLVIYTENELPFEGTIDMQLLAADSSVLFQFPNAAFMKSPVVPESGRVEAPETETTIIPVYRGNGYQELLDASVLNLVLHITSYNASEDTYVKIFSDYELFINVGTEVSVNYEF